MTEAKARTGVRVAPIALVAEKVFYGTFPSQKPDTALAALPGGPYELSPGSRGAPFTVVLDPVRTDIPLDPTSTTLVVTKDAGSDHAGAGDFVKYEIEVANRHTTPSHQESHMPIGPVQLLVVSFAERGLL